MEVGDKTFETISYGALLRNGCLQIDSVNGSAWLSRLQGRLGTCNRRVSKIKTVILGLLHNHVYVIIRCEVNGRKRVDDTERSSRS